MPWFEFQVSICGGLEAANEEEARMEIEMACGGLGMVDIEELTCEDDESED